MSETQTQCQEAQELGVKPSFPISMSLQSPPANGLAWHEGVTALGQQTKPLLQVVLELGGVGRACNRESCFT